jgi:hypothetical protein
MEVAEMKREGFSRLSYASRGMNLNCHLFSSLSALEPQFLNLQPWGGGIKGKSGAGFKMQGKSPTK